LRHVANGKKAEGNGSAGPGRPAMALFAGEARIGGRVLLQRGFVAAGAVAFPSARIEGRFRAEGARIIGPSAGVDPVALDFEGADIGGDFSVGWDPNEYGARTYYHHHREASIFSDDPENLPPADREAPVEDVLPRTLVMGRLDLSGARIGGSLDLLGASLIHPEGKALKMRSARVEGISYLNGRRSKQSKRHDFVARGVVDLSFAKLGALTDDAESLPAILDLTGLIYEDIEPKDLAHRERWLARDRRYAAQPYEQLAKVLKETGHADDARQVLYLSERHRPAAGMGRLWRRGVYGPLLGYGCRPGRALAALAILWMLGTAIFAAAHRQGVMVPTEADALEAFASGTPRAAYPTFLPAIYSADAMIPVIDLHQKGYWIPARGAAPQENAAAKRAGAFAEIYLRLHILLGWALSAAAIAGFAHLARRE
jgi:hypothetical protein